MVNITCPNCKYEGVGKNKVEGNFAIELVLWLIGLVFFPLLIVAIIYSVWRLANKNIVCPQCGFKNVVKTYR